MSGIFCTSVQIFMFTASMLHYLHRNNMLTNLKVADLKALGVHIHVTQKQSI